MKNKILSTILGLMVALVFVNCDGDDDPDLVGNWVESTDFNGVRRSGASIFVIGKDAYLVGGFNYKSYFNETWKYDSEKDTWKKMAAFPGAGRKYGVAFGINGKGYYGTGVDKLANKRADFYEFTPDDSIGTWKRIDSFPNKGIVSAVGFAVGNYGYVGTGYDDDGASKYMFQYDPSQNKWEEVEGVKVSKRYGASTFIIDQTVYFVGGVENSMYVVDFVSFNPTTNEWKTYKKLSEYNKDLARDAASAFSINGKGYLLCGRNSGALTDTWEYDPLTDEWKERTAFEGSGRYNAIGFAIGNYGYVATGNSGTSENSYFDDIWKFAPDDKYNDED